MVFVTPANDKLVRAGQLTLRECQFPCNHQRHNILLDKHWNDTVLGAMNAAVPLAMELVAKPRSCAMLSSGPLTTLSKLARQRQ